MDKKNGGLTRLYSFITSSPNKSEKKKKKAKKSSVEEVKTKLDFDSNEKKSKPLLGLFSPTWSSIFPKFAKKGEKEQEIEEDTVELEAEEDAVEAPEVDEIFEEFCPYLFIKSLPPLSHCVPLHRKNLLPKKTRVSKKKTLVLDLDETLVHSSLEGESENLGCNFTFPVYLQEDRFDVYVWIRPGAIDFLEEMVKDFEIVIFTASQKVYAESLLNILDPKRKYIRHRLFRDSCVFVEGNYLKDLSILGRDLKDTIIVDNSPQAFGFQLSNGVPIESWFDDMQDRELLKLIPFLRRLVQTEDVRPSIRKRFKLHEKVERAS